MKNIITVTAIALMVSMTSANAGVKEFFTNNYNASQGNPTKVSKERLKQFFVDNYNASQGRP